MRLRALVDDGILEKVPYQEPGARARDEYRLTDKGLDLYPVLVGLLQWGDKYLADDEGPSLTLTQVNGDGTATTLALTDVLVSSWSAGGSVASEGASENVSFVFGKVCLTDGASGAKFCFDVKANTKL